LVVGTFTTNGDAHESELMADADTVMSSDHVGFIGGLFSSLARGASAHCNGAKGGVIAIGIHLSYAPQGGRNERPITGGIFPSF
jgi:hypothetical protein